jgi:hypothetical protein
MRAVALDMRFAQHPRLVAAGPVGMLLYLAAATYVQAYDTHGFISLEALDRLIPYEGLNPRGVIARCVGEGLFDRVYEDGREGVRVVPVESVRAIASSSARVTRHRQARRAQPRLFEETADSAKRMPGEFSTFPQASTGETLHDALHETLHATPRDLKNLDLNQDQRDQSSPGGGDGSKHVFAAAAHELAAHPELRDPIEQLEHVKTICARARLPHYERYVVSAVEAARRRRSVRGP